MFLLNKHNDMMSHLVKEYNPPKDGRHLDVDMDSYQSYVHLSMTQVNFFCLTLSLQYCPIVNDTSQLHLFNPLTTVLSTCHWHKSVVFI